jgi:hypothetical protein
MNSTMPPERRLSPYLLAILVITLLLSVISIYSGVMEFMSGQETTGSFYMSIGMATLALSAYIFYQSRSRVIRLASLQIQPLSTTLQCQKCGFKNTREFQRGDFVFKQTDQPCPKDNEKMMVAAIYREVKEKEKPKESTYV